MGIVFNCIGFYRDLDGIFDPICSFLWLVVISLRIWLRENGWIHKNNSSVCAYTSKKELSCHEVCVILCNNKQWPQEQLCAIERPFWTPMILKEQNKNKTKLWGTSADNNHKHNACDKRADVMKRARFRERTLCCWEQFIKTYVTSSLKIKNTFFFFFFFKFCNSETHTAAEQPA